ncbi:MAG: radical SAM protein [Verrucomicrobia bacterium]|nr:radical SAM protein [Verrucomicrobiota bacterium]
MNLVFVNPNFANYRSKDAMQPLVFAILASLTPKHVNIKLFDERVENVDLDWPADLVAMSVQSFTARRAYGLAQMYRARGIPVILGGVHPSLLPEEAQQMADSIVIGDAEKIWPQIIEDFQAGQLQKVYHGDNLHPLDGIRPDRSIFADKKYSSFIPVQFGRGCKFACDFCSVRAYYGNTIRQRPVDDVIDEIKALGSKHLFFIDDNLFLNFANALQLFEALIPLKVRWICQISIDAAFNDELLSLMKRGGCRAVFVGLESFSDQNLKQMKKACNLKHTDYHDAIKRFKSYGIMVCGSFVFGYDEDTAEAIQGTLAFALKAKLCLAHFNPLFPTPKTPLYERLQAEGRLNSEKWWVDPRFTYGDGLFQPKKMSSDEVSFACFKARITFNTYFNILRRAIDFKANAGNLFNLKAYLAANLVSRIEIYKKQWLILGKNRLEKRSERAQSFASSRLVKKVKHGK